MTSYPLLDMFENRVPSGRIGKWATQIAAYTIDFILRSAIKSQVLADFIVEWTLVPDIKCLEETATPAAACNEQWTTAT